MKKQKEYTSKEFESLTGYCRQHLWLLRFGSDLHKVKPIFTEGADYVYRRGRLFWTAAALAKIKNYKEQRMRSR